MKKKTKLRRSMIIGSVIATLALPASVYAALQPLDFDLGNLNSGQTPFDLGTIDEQLPIDLDNIDGLGTINEELPIDLSNIDNLGLPVNGQQNGSTLTGSEVLLQVPPIISTTKDIFRSINTGNIEGAINRILGILGELGLVDPAYEATRVGTDPDNPYSDPQTPEEVYESQRHTDIARSEVTQKVSRIVFGPLGQKNLVQQEKALQQAQQASLKGQVGVAATYQQSTVQAQQNANSASIVAAQAQKAQSANVSQDVMKALAAQNEDLAKIGAGNSAQLAHLGKATSYQSAQLSATNSQLNALNDKTQTLEILSAAQNEQASQINAAIESQKHYQQLKDSLQMSSSYQSSSLIYIPGLVSTTEAQQ